MKRFKWLTAGALLLILVVGSMTLRSSAESPAAERPSRFQGKIVLVFVDNSSALEARSSSEFLKEPVIERIGDRDFIIGAVQLSPQERSNSQSLWREGAIVWIAWNRVANLYVYSPEQFENTFKAVPDDE
jgi:hypothetical protein